VAKIKYDDTGVDIGGGARPAPPEGIYEAIVTEAKVEPKKSDPTTSQLVVICEIQDEEEAYDGYRLWSYFPLPWKKTDPGAWKRAQFLNATTGSVKGTFDTDSIDDLFAFKVKTKNEMYNEVMRAKIETFIAIDPDEEEEDEEEVEEATPAAKKTRGAKKPAPVEDVLDEDEDEEEEPAPPKKGRGKAAAKPEPEPEEEDGEEIPPYEEWSLADLKSEVEDRELDAGAIPKSAPRAKAHLIKLLEADDEEADD
jgi:hypothetical protein